MSLSPGCVPGGVLEPVLTERRTSGEGGVNEAYLPAQEAASSAAAWVPRADAHLWRTPGARSATRQGTQAVVGLVFVDLTALRGRANFKRVFAHGGARRSDGVVLHWVANGTAHNRYGVAAKVHVGHAVVRNRVRRWARELLRRWDASLAAGYDVVVVANQPEAAASFESFAWHLARVLGKAELGESLSLQGAENV